MKSFWVICALVIGLSTTAGFAYTMATGTVVLSPRESFVPSEVKSQPGGYRSFHFWHVGYAGYRGGK